MSDQGPHSEDLSGIIILRNTCFHFIFFPLTRRTKVSVSWHHPIKNHDEDLSGSMSSLLLSLCAFVEIWLSNMIYATAILEWQNHIAYFWTGGWRLLNIFIKQLVMNCVVTQNLFCVQVTSEKVSALMEVAQLRQDCHRFEEREKYGLNPSTIYW